MFAARGLNVRDKSSLLETLVVRAMVITLEKK